MGTLHDELRDSPRATALSWLLTSSAAESLRFSPRARLELVVSVDEISRALRALTNRLKTAIGLRLECARRVLMDTLRPSGVAAGFVADTFRTHDELLAENAALRRQVIVASRKVKKPQLRGLERGLLVALASRTPAWRHAILLVKPDTILR